MIPKFRLFDKDTKEWQSIRSIGLEEDGSILYIQCWDKYEEDIDPPYFMDNLGIDFELVQSTGLHDVNGKEIFEGDIVKYWENIGYIEFYQGSWVINWNDGSLFDLYDNDNNLEVIGNIHEHSHLLDNGGQ